MNFLIFYIEIKVLQYSLCSCGHTYGVHIHSGMIYFVCWEGIILKWKSISKNKFYVDSQVMQRNWSCKIR